LPAIGWQEIEPLIPIAGSCFVVIVAQSSATARFYALRHRQPLDENADLIGLCAANTGAALSGTFVVDGSPTQTAMVESSGGQSQIAQITTAGLVALVLLFLTRPLQFLPRCVLGSMVFVVAASLVDLRSLRDIRRESPGEYMLALLTAAVVVLVGVQQAIVLAMVLSRLRVLQHSYHPQTGVLVPDEHGWSEMRPPVPGAQTQPGLVIYRFGAPLFYANADRFSREIRDLVGPAPSRLRWLIVDAEAVTNIDYSAARMVRQLHGELKQRGVQFAFARVAMSLRSDLIRHRLLVEVIGAGRIYNRLHEAVAAFEEKPAFASNET
jgi:MFS superfamily sulfate permease-like transporter